MRRLTAPSSNGKTTDSDSVNRGSNPRGASINPFLIEPRNARLHESRRVVLLALTSLDATDAEALARLAEGGPQPETLGSIGRLGTVLLKSSDVREGHFPFSAMKTLKRNRWMCVYRLAQKRM